MNGISVELRGRLKAEEGEHWLLVDKIIGDKQVERQVCVALQSS